MWKKIKKIGLKFDCQFVRRANEGALENLRRGIVIYAELYHNHLHFERSKISFFLCKTGILVTQHNKLNHSSKLNIVIVRSPLWSFFVNYDK